MGNKVPKRRLLRQGRVERAKSPSPCAEETKGESVQPTPSKGHTQPSLADTPTDPPTSSTPTGHTSDSDPTLPFPMARVLTISDLPALMMVLGNAAHYTYNLGIQLGLDPHLVRTLNKQSSGDLVEFLSLVLEVRLKDFTSPLTLHDLHDAIFVTPVGDEDLAWRLQQHFEGENQSQPLTRTSGVTLSPAMAAYSEHLDDVYNNMAIPSDPKGGPVPGTIFINLAVVKKQEVSPRDADEFTKATLHGGIDEIMHKKEAIELKDIFKSEDQKFVLVEGAPGVGKSTLAWELCRRRHEIESMRKFSAVLLLRLRDKEVQEARSLADLLFHDDPDNEAAVAKEIRSSRGENLLLILDGFDEVPASIRKSFYLAKVISGQYLPQATVLMTSRPSARADLTSLRRPDKHIEVLGFTRELIGQYASSIFGADSPVLADFGKYVSTNPAIKTMMHIPLNCAIVVELYRETREEGRPIPQTMTQLYSELTLALMRRHLRERGDNWESLPRRLEDLPQKHLEVHCQLLGLSKLAFEATLKQVVIFEGLPPGCSTLGLMTASQQLFISRRGSTNYNFFHLTMQEFLSAYHVSQLPGSEQKEAFEQFSEERAFSHMEVVWRFVAGLTGFRDIGWEVVQLRRGKSHTYQTDTSPFLLQCLYEAQEKVSCESVLGRSAKVKHHPTSISDSFALGYCIAVSRCTWDVNMFFSRGPGSLDMLVLGLRSEKEVRGSIDSLDLYSIGPEGMVHFTKMPDKVLQQLSHLNLPLWKPDGRVLELLADVIPTMTSLKYLSINTNTRIGVGIATKLLQSLATIHLHTLHMDGIPMGHDDVMFLSDLLRPPGGLKELTVGDQHMQLESVELLLKTVLSPSSLQTLYLCHTEVVGTSLSFLPLKDNCNLVTLQLTATKIGSRDLSCIAEALNHNSTLEELSLHSIIQSSGDVDTNSAVRDLADALKVNQSLKELYLDIMTPDIWTHNSALTEEGALALTDAFQCNRKLKVTL